MIRLRVSVELGLVYYIYSYIDTITSIFMLLEMNISST